MPVSSQHFVLYQYEGRIHASILPSYPAALSYQGKTYLPSKYSLIDFNHLLGGGAVVGFDFLIIANGGEEFLSSRFVQGSANVFFHEGTLAIHLGNCAGAESDQGSFMGAFLFESGGGDYLIVLSDTPEYRPGIGFELQTRDVPVPHGNQGETQ
jgi:hypothetical protein